jgi:hypothetical protein
MRLLKMLDFVKYYVFDEKHKAIAVQIPIDDFERIENVIENYGLAQMMDETGDDERLGLDDAKIAHHRGTEVAEKSSVRQD